MKYEQKEKILRLSAEELVSVGYFHYGAEELAALPLLLPPPAEAGEAREAVCGFSLDALPCRMQAHAAVREEGEGRRTLSLCFSVEGSVLTLSSAEEKYMRALAFAHAYAFSDGMPLSLCFSVADPYGASRTWEETPDACAVERFFEKMIVALAADATREVERVSERLPSFLSVAFPYADAREGQADMMSAVYTAAKQGETLFAVAPTGTGKTMAVLFPAMRAMGAGHIGRTYYFTPRNTSAIAAAEAAALLADRGMRLRALHLVAKERLCEGRRANASCYGCPRRRGGKRSIRTALDALLTARHPVVGERLLSETAKRYGVCPYALATEYVRYADLVIGDYNYLFDSHATPRTFFAQDEDAFLLIDEAHNLPDRAREMYSGGLDGELFALLRTLFADSARLCEYIEKLDEGFRKTVDALLRDELRTAEDGTVRGFASVSRFPASFGALLRRVTDALSEALAKRPHEESATDRERRESVLRLSSFLEKLDLYDGHYVTYAQREGEARLLRFFCIDPSERISERLDLGRGAVFFSATLTPLDYYRSVLCGKRHTVKIEIPSPFESGALCVGIMDKISVRASTREETLPEIAKIIVTAMRARRGNYMVFCPSYEYMERIAQAFRALTPKTPMAVQKRQMSREEREAFLSHFEANAKGYFVGFCVSGGIFSEGVDLPGERLIGTVVVGVGLPSVSAERELIASYYGDLYDEGKEYAYLYPGLNRILQAAGRVIRSERDRGVAVLIDDRLRDPACKRVFPPAWRGLKYVGDRAALTALLSRFWKEVDSENENKGL